MLYGSKMPVALTKIQEAEMEVAGLKMLRFSLGVTRMDNISTECIRGTAQVGRFGEKTLEARLRWFGLWTCTEERLWVGRYLENDADDGIVKKGGTWMR